MYLSHFISKIANIRTNGIIILKADKLQNKNSSGDEISNVNFYAVRPGSYRNSLK